VGGGRGRRLGLGGWGGGGRERGGGGGPDNPGSQASVLSQTSANCARGDSPTAMRPWRRQPCCRSHRLGAGRGELASGARSRNVNHRPPEQASVPRLAPGRGFLPLFKT